MDDEQRLRLRILAKNILIMKKKNEVRAMVEQFLTALIKEGGALAEAAQEELTAFQLKNAGFDVRRRKNRLRPDRLILFNRLKKIA